MKRARVIYWFAGADLRADGGGSRAMAWRAALTTLGYEAEILPLRVLGGTGGAGSFLSSAKRQFLPMPLEQQLPDVQGADLVIATVPGVFRSAARTVERERLVFDWMDRWSTAARSMRRTTFFSGPGSALQEALWRRREHTLPTRARGNAYAGYNDFEQMGRATETAHAWVPNPVPWVSRPHPSKEKPRIERVGFIGSLDYPPNEASLRQFFSRYGDRLREAGIEVVVAGFGSDRVAQWGVHATVLGQVSSPDALYELVDAAIVPVDHGGGIKIKAIEALAYGLPVFATQHVREGFSPEFHGHIQDMDALFESSPRSSASVTKSKFDSVFSQDAFTATVEGLVHG